MQPIPLFFGVVSTKESLSIFIDDLFFGSRYDVQLHGKFFEFFCSL